MNKRLKIFLFIVSYLIAIALGGFIIFFVNNIYEWWAQGGVFDLKTLGVYLGAAGSVGAIFIVWWSTKKQITSQNKEINRPYLALQSVSEVNNTEYVYELEYVNYSLVKNQSNYSGYYRKEAIIQFSFLNHGRGSANIKAINYVDGGKECRFLGGLENNGVFTGSIRTIGPHSCRELSFLSIYSLKNVELDYCIIEVIYLDVDNNEYSLKFKITLKEKMGNTIIHYRIL